MPEFYDVQNRIDPILKANNPPLTPADLRATPGQDERHVGGHMVAAHRLSKVVSLAAEVLYGVFREELPSELELLLARPPAAIRKAIIRAIADNIIARGTAGEKRQAFAAVMENIIEDALPHRLLY